MTPDAKRGAVTAAPTGALGALLRAPFETTAQALEPVLTGPRAAARAVAALAALVVSWYVYVPVHELLHALGCAATGGTVTTLEIQAQYGGALLAHLFPFVTVGSDYAGRLSGFDTHGSDLVYLATDALPFSLSVGIGVPLLRACAVRSRPLLLGPACVLGLAPFYNLPGDYFEMGSIVVTRVLGRVRFEHLRSDDLFQLLASVWQQASRAGDLVLPLAVVCTAGALAVVLAYATWWLGDCWAALVLRGGAGSET